MRIYIAGPMMGVPNLNRSAFDDAEALLENLGHSVMRPCRLNEASMLWQLSAAKVGSLFWPALTKDEDITPEYLREITSRDLSVLFTCDRIALLPGWEDSPGASLERQTAHYVGIQSVELTSAQMEAGHAARTSTHAAESGAGSP